MRGHTAIMPGILLNWLTMLADQGAPCPTNEAMAEAIGLAQANDITRILRNLAKAGHIIIVSGQRRSIAIVKTGKVLVTGRRRTRVCQMREGLDQTRAMSSADIAARVERDQAARRDAQMAALVAEAAKYGLPRRGRLLSEMAA